MTPTRWRVCKAATEFVGLSVARWHRCRPHGCMAVPCSAGDAAARLNTAAHAAYGNHHFTAAESVLKGVQVSAPAGPSSGSDCRQVGQGRSPGHIGPCPAAGAPCGASADFSARFSQQVLLSVVQRAALCIHAQSPCSPRSLQAVQPQRTDGLTLCLGWADGPLDGLGRVCWLCM